MFRGGAEGGNPAEPARRGAAGSPIFNVIAVLCLFTVAGLGGAGSYFLPAIRAAVSQTGQRDRLTSPTAPPRADPAVSPSPAATPSAAAVGGAAFTVLLLGSDDDSKFPADRVLTQSMILVRVIPDEKRVTLLSIPRDLYVPLPSGVVDKIDLAYRDGRERSAIAAVERNFHVHVDEYAWIGLKGLIRLIDRFGGVDVLTSNPVLDDFYPDDINDANPYAYTRVAILPAAQHLDGIHALQYVRSRHGDLRGDFGRSIRQQQVLLALRSRAQELNPADLPDIATALEGEFRTSMDLQRLRQLLGMASAFDTSRVQTVVLLPPYTSSAVIGGADVLIPDWGLILPLVHQTFP